MCKAVCLSFSLLLLRVANREREWRVGERHVTPREVLLSTLWLGHGQGLESLCNTMIKRSSFIFYLNNMIYLNNIILLDSSHSSIHFI